MILAKNFHSKGGVLGGGGVHFRELFGALWPNRRPLCRIRHMGDQKPMGFCIFYQHDCDRGVIFCNVMAKNPWLFAYLSITTATGVLVSAMRFRKSNGFFAHFALPCLLPKGDTQPKAKICSKREDLVFAVTTFGSLLTISKNQISCGRPKYDRNVKI